MATGPKRRGPRSPKTRVQLDLSPDQMVLVNILEERLSTRSRADLVQEALGALLWFVTERRQGRKVVSVDPAESRLLKHVVELALPSVALQSPDLFEHLVARPHPWRKQLSLKGRNMTVGQLVATMQANHLTPEQASADLAVPLAQITEARRYAQIHRHLIAEEFAEEKRRLGASGVDVGSEDSTNRQPNEHAPVPG